jgi:3-hydroxyacyl-CoA dehydrogenase
LSQPISVAVEDGIAVITVDNPPVNAISAAMRRGLRQITRQLATDPAVKAVAVFGAGRTFIAGADISEFAGTMAPPMLRDVLAEFEQLPQPIVVALHGTALGGGVELALAGHYRIAQQGAKLGFPEVTLGVVPGAVGTQRLPRLVVAAAEIVVADRHRIGVGVVDVDDRGAVVGGTDELAVLGDVIGGQHLDR